MKQQLFVPDHADRRLIVSAYLLSVLFLALFVPFHLGVNVPIFILCIYIAAFSYQKHTNAPIDRGSTTLLLIVMVASLPFVLYDVSPFRVLHFCILMGAVLFQLYTMFSCRAYPRLSESWLFDLGNAILCVPFSNLDAFWRVIFRRFGQSRFRTAFLVFSGILFALPLLFLMNLQLSSADAIFDFMKARFSGIFWRYLGLAVLGLWAAIPIAMLFYGAFYGFRHRRSIHAIKKPKDGSLHILPSEAVTTALLPVCLLQAGYLISQIVYLSSTFSGFLMENFSYAEYARRGFLELCGVALVNIALIAAAMSFTKYKKPRSEIIVRVLVVFLSVCSIALIVIALTKMLLYMLSFGLTTNRIITSWFMLGLALVFIFTIVRCWKPSFKLVRTSTVAALVMFLMLCFMDCDYLAVQYNRDAYLNGRLEGFDIEMLYDASDSVIPLVIDIYENGEGVLQESARARLLHYSETYEDSPAAWRSFNITRYHARTVFLEWQESSGFDPNSET